MIWLWGVWGRFGGSKDAGWGVWGGVMMCVCLCMVHVLRAGKDGVVGLAFWSVEGVHCFAGLSV